MIIAPPLVRSSSTLPQSSWGVRFHDTRRVRGLRDRQHRAVRRQRDRGQVGRRADSRRVVIALKMYYRTSAIQENPYLQGDIRFGSESGCVVFNEACGSRGARACDSGKQAGALSGGLIGISAPTRAGYHPPAQTLAGGGAPSPEQELRSIPTCLLRSVSWRGCDRSNARKTP
jgi:hypothetical protein